MNEQLKALAEQAGAYFGGGTTDYFGDYLPPYMSITDVDLEKFAELIVRECAGLGYRYAENSYEVYNKILEHFGVEE